jgi:hypothetical protein
MALRNSTVCASLIFAATLTAFSTSAWAQAASTTASPSVSTATDGLSGGFAGFPGGSTEGGATVAQNDCVSHYKPPHRPPF